MSEAESPFDRLKPVLRGVFGEWWRFMAFAIGSAALFGINGKSFAYVAHEESYEVLNATVTAWFNPVDLGGQQTILAKDESNADGGGPTGGTGSGADGSGADGGDGGGGGCGCRAQPRFPAGGGLLLLMLLGLRRRLRPAAE